MVRRPKVAGDPQARTPVIVAGDWSGEFVNAGSLTYGQMDQPGRPVHVVEFSYLVAPIIARSPDKREWGGVVMIMPPPRGEALLEAGGVMHGAQLPTIHLSLNATRVQFSDLIRHLEMKRLSGLRFTLVADGQKGWRVSGWHISVELR
jgi:hypothetical protein